MGCDLDRALPEPSWFHVLRVGLTLATRKTCSSVSRRLIILLVKEHTPEATALGALNGVTELAQMVGILIDPPVITFVLLMCSLAHAQDSTDLFLLTLSRTTSWADISGPL